MKALLQVCQWQLAVQPLDMRSGMDSLVARVVEVFGQAQVHVAYVFTNARRTRMKVLVNDGFGLWLCTRRLNCGGFVWPGSKSTGPIELGPQQWQALTLGLNWQQVNRSITVV
jgi:transposase